MRMVQRKGIEVINLFESATKTAAKTTRATAPVETVKVQFGGDEYDFAEIKQAVEADYKSKFEPRSRLSSFTSSRRIRQFTTLSTVTSPIRSTFDLTVL